MLTTLRPSRSLAATIFALPALPSPPLPYQLPRDILKSSNCFHWSAFTLLWTVQQKKKKQFSEQNVSTKYCNSDILAVKLINESES